MPEAEMISIPARDGGEFGAYLAGPEVSGPGIVVIQEIFGVNAGMREISDRLAAAGYLAACPDLFWRQEPGVELTDQTEADWQRAMELMNGFDTDKGIDDIQTTIATLRARGATQVGAIGFCLGGKLAYLSACRTDSDASVAYYGVGIDGLLNEAAAIRHPLLMHIAEQDGFVDKEAQAKIHAGLESYPMVTIYDYPGVDHAFARPNGINYDAEAAALADSRTLEFLKKYLSGP